ncbi:DNA polymerase III subunit gamma and tau [Corynebacterium freneyi]|uniref:DNA-directed DNA polymerase n=1 Tax=Corynebacterium freneyi TaxID=134034 RepID=A0ABS4UB73_9CORY|nr:DNA polymerase III subunit gamma and tau [Corynebacterium freneyi]MBP2333760.1 DNA polymerase-3 subunit gamma/tau [Corynebacterium freneyi]QXA52248.1 DNA polymerase III subunit gamma and tau [Corynebacterium freneyi]WJZ04138.1 DNA polymerase III subunit tau [Corynebacterium freneyi]
MALYRKYRPATFAEVVGQRHVTDPLSAALESRGADGTPDRINHAYLFSGPRGCGKTSSARILARSLNCAEGPTATPCGKCASCVALGPGGPGNLDVVELDAASHNKVEDMRDLRAKAMYAPAESRYRIFIIDEAHMVTQQGFNALLKIVEEPPEHLIFIFATTEPESVLTTIRSRTHHYPFRLLPPNLMRGLLERIVGEERVPVADDVYPLVVRAGGGSPRDSLSVMDQLLAGAGPDGVTYDLAAGLLGVTDQSLLDDALSALSSADRAALFGCVDRVIRSGQDPKRFAEDLLGRVRDLLVIAAVPNAMEEGLVDAPEDRVEAMREQATSVPTGTLTRFADVLQRGLPDMSGATSPRLLLEVLCARMLLPASEQTVESLIQRIEALERGGVGGAAAGAAGGAGVAQGHAGQAPQQSQPQYGRQQAQQRQQVPQPQQPQQSAPAGGVGGPADDPNLSPLQRARLARQAQNPQAAQQAQQPPVQQPEPEQSGPAPQPQQPEPPVQQPQAQHAAPQQPGAHDVPDQEEQARKALEMREISRRMQEQAREHERAERERLAKEREAATRAAEGDEGAVPPQPEEAEASSRDHLASLRQAWPQVVEYAGENNIPVRVMASQAVPIALDDGVLTIGHHTGALANRLNDAANAAALGAAVQRVEGIEVEVRCVVGTAPRGGADRSGARPRQHQAPAAEGSEDAKPSEQPNPATVEQPSQAPTEQPTPAPAEPSSSAPAEQSGPVPAYRRILEERRRAQEAAQRNAEDSNGRSGNRGGPGDGTGQAAQGGHPGVSDALAAARQAVQQTAAARDQGAGEPKKYVPPPPAPGTQGVVKRRYDDVPPPPEPYDDVPPPPEPYDDVPPPPEPDFGGHPDYGGRRGRHDVGGPTPSTPTGPSGTGGATPPAPGVDRDGLDDEERELIDAARTPGELDHRDQKTVVMELLAKELGAKPM